MQVTLPVTLGNMPSNLDGFRQGKTDHDEEDIFVSRGALGAAIVPRSARKLSPEAKADLADLQRCVGALNTLIDTLPGLVEDLRDQGVSWGVIGWAVGTTGEAARQRWRDPS